MVRSVDSSIQARVAVRGGVPSEKYDIVDRDRTNHFDRKSHQRWGRLGQLTPWE